MKAKIYSLLRMLIAFLFILTVAACESGNETAATVTPSPVANAPNIPAATEEVEEVVITFAGQEASRENYETLMAQFHQAYPAITVQFVSLDEAANQETGLDMRQRATLADSTILLTPVSPQESSYFLDLEPLITASDNFNSSDFWPGALASCQTSQTRKQVGLPITLIPRFIIFDGAVFATANVPMPSPGWTWQDFQVAVTTLTEREGDQISRYGFVDYGAPVDLLGPVIEPFFAAHPLDPALLANNLQWYIDFVSTGAIPAFDNNEDPFSAITMSQALIDNRQATMWLGGLLDLTKQWSSGRRDVGIAPYPLSSEQDQTTPVFPSCAVISAGSRHPQAAWTWLQFLSKHDLPRSLNSLPARPSVAEEFDSWSNFDLETSAAIRFGLEHAWYGHFNSLPAPAAEAINRAIVAKVDLEAALQPLTEAPLSETPVALDNGPITVATPQMTATAVMAAANHEVAARYFVDPNFHINFEAVKALADAFNQGHPNMTIDVSEDESVFGGGYGMFNIGQFFDCYTHSLEGAIYGSELLYSLDPLLDTEETVLHEDFYPGLLATAKVNGVLYGLPVAIQPQVIYYNKTHLQSVGLTPPPPDWSVGDFWELATTAKEGGNNPVFGFLPYNLEAFDFLLADAGIQLYDTTTTAIQVNFNQPEVKNLLESFVSMTNSGVLFPSDFSESRTLRGASNAGGDLISSGQVALWNNRAGFPYGVYTEPGGPGYEVGIAPLPVRVSLPNPDGLAMYISHQAEDPNACWEWMMFLSAQPNVFYGIPGRRSVVESEAWETTIGPDVAVAYRASLTYQTVQEPDVFRDAFPSFPLRRWWADVLTGIFAGEDIGQLLIAAQQKGEEYVACMSTFINPSSEQVNQCVQQTDPDF